MIETPQRLMPVQVNSFNRVKPLEHSINQLPTVSDTLAQHNQANRAQQRIYVPEPTNKVASIPEGVVRAFDNRNYVPVADPIAKLAPDLSWPEEVKRRLQVTKTTIGRALQGKPVTDQHMAETSMTLRQLGGAGIAGLAALCSGSILFGAKEALGALSFFGVGMLAPIAIIDGVLKHRTGLGFSQRYVTSYNDAEIKPLFSDPYYLPLQVLPENQVSEAAARLGTFQNLEEENQQRANKTAISKAVTQRWAVWMLAAGGLTPLLASWTSHLVEPLVEAPLLKSTAWLKEKRLQWLSLFTSDKKQVALCEDYTNQLIGKSSNAGKNTDSLMAHWWRKLGPKLLKKLSIHYDASLTASEQVDNVARHFLRMPATERQNVRHVIDKSSNQLLTLGNRLNRVLDTQENRVRQTIIQHLEAAQRGDLNGGIETWLEKLRQPGYRFTLPELADAYKGVTQSLGNEIPALDKALSHLERLVELRDEGLRGLMNGMATLANYDHAINLGEKRQAEWSSITQDARRNLLRPIRDLVDKTTFPNFKELSERFLEQPVQELFGQANYEPMNALLRQFHGEKALGWKTYVKQLIMKPDNLQQRYKAAYELFGKPPASHLNEALKEASLQTLWRKNVGVATLTFLGGTLAASAFFIGAPRSAQAEANRFNKLVSKPVDTTLPTESDLPSSHLVPSETELQPNEMPAVLNSQRLPPKQQPAFLSATTPITAYAGRQPQ